MPRGAMLERDRPPFLTPAFDVCSRIAFGRQGCCLAQPGGTSLAASRVFPLLCRLERGTGVARIRDMDQTKLLGRVSEFAHCAAALSLGLLLGGCSGSVV